MQVCDSSNKIGFNPDRKHSKVEVCEVYGTYKFIQPYMETRVKQVVFVILLSGFNLNSTLKIA